MTEGQDGSAGPGDDYETERPVDNVIAAIIVAIDAGRPVDPRSWVARHPQFAAELEEFFADLDAVGEQFRKSGMPDPTVTAAVAPGAEQQNGVLEVTLDLPPQPKHVTRPVAPAFGRCYTLLKRIGGGGQGEVWKAFQSNPDRLVAIKIVKGGYLAATDDVRRFRDETEIISRLDHPNIIPVYEVGEHLGHHYFSMKLMAGGSLARRVAGYRNEPEEAVDLIIQIAETVQHAHKHGVIHRDLKPLNILFDAEGRPYLTDFGLAKRFSSDVETTESGSIVGTAAYMSPEQASGKKGMVTTASDVYGLGATLYAVLTGCPPFAGASVLEILDQVRQCPPVSPSKLNPKVPRDLAAVCLKCLEKTPARRYETALKVAEDLRNWRQGKPTVARPVGPLVRLGKWCRRRPGIAAALAAVVLVAALGVTGVLLQLRETKQALASEARTNYFNHIALAAQAWDDENFGRAAELLAGYTIDQRGWEWYYLMGLRQRPPVRIEKGHDGAVYSVAFSPDGRYLASGGSDKQVKVWNAATGQLVRTLGEHAKTVRCVAFSPDGRYLASASWDGTIKVWDFATHQPVYEPLVGDKGKVISVAFSHDSKRIASAGDDGFVRIWDAVTGRPCPSFRAHKNTILGVAFSPDGKYIASASDDGVVALWDAVDHSPIPTALERIESVRGVSFSPDSLHLALAVGDGTVQVLDTRTGRLVFTPRGGHTDVVRGTSYSPQGARIASASGDGTVKLWDSLTGQEAITLHPHRDRRKVVVRGVAFSPNSERLAAACNDGTICIWEAPRVTSQSDALQVLTGHRGPVYGVAYSPNSQHVATAGGDTFVRIWDVTTGKPARDPLVGHTGQVYAVAYSPDRKYLASAGADKVVRKWDAATGLLVRTLSGHEDDVWCVAFSRNGQYLASADGAGKVKLWDVRTDRLVRTIDADEREVWSVAFSPDGEHIAVGCTGGNVKIWDVGGALSPALAWEKPGHDDNVYGLAFSPDGARLATAGGDQAIRIWDARTGDLGPSFTGLGRADGVVFSPDGGYLCAAFGDGTVKVWNAGSDSREPVRVLYGHTSRVLGVAFSPNGERLVSAGFDGTARVWDTTSWPRPSNTPVQSRDAAARLSVPGR
jgi:WD40 repeat protein